MCKFTVHNDLKKSLKKRQNTADSKTLDRVKKNPKPQRPAKSNNVHHIKTSTEFFKLYKSKKQTFD